MTNWDHTLEQWVGRRKTIHPDGEIKRTNSDGQTIYDVYRYGDRLPHVTVMID